MPNLILPATVKYNLERERMAVRHHALQDFDRQLKELDPNLELVRAHENAGAPGMIPGFWHARHTSPVTGWQTYIALRGPQGQFSEPHSGHIEMLRQADLQRPGGMEEFKRRLEREEEDRAKALAWTRAEMHEEFADRYMNKVRPSISFANVNGWRNSVRARKA